MELKRFEYVIIIDFFLIAILFSIINNNLRLIFSVGLVSGTLATIYNEDYNKSLGENIIIVIIAGLVMMLPMFVSDYYLNKQLKSICVYIIFSFVQFLSWYILYTVVNSSKEYLILKSRDFNRFGLGDKKSILSKEEYNLRREFIVNGINEGNDPAYEVKLSIFAKENKPYFNSIFEIVGEALSRELRENFDIISVLDKNTYIFLVQNMNDEKFEDTMQKIYLWLDSHLIGSHNFIHITKTVIRGNVDD